MNANIALREDKWYFSIQEGEPDALAGQRKANPAKDKTTCNE